MVTDISASGRKWPKFQALVMVLIVLIAVESGKKKKRT